MTTYSQSPKFTLWFSNPDKGIVKILRPVNWIEAMRVWDLLLQYPEIVTDTGNHYIDTMYIKRIRR